MRGLHTHVASLGNSRNTLKKSACPSGARELRAAAVAALAQLARSPPEPPAPGAPPYFPLARCAAAAESAGARLPSDAAALPGPGRYTALRDAVRPSYWLRAVHTREQLRARVHLRQGDSTDGVWW